jgi:hypothetical protein
VHFVDSIAGRRTLSTFGTDTVDFVDSIAGRRTLSTLCTDPAAIRPQHARTKAAVGHPPRARRDTRRSIRCRRWPKAAQTRQKHSLGVTPGPPQPLPAPTPSRSPTPALRPEAAAGYASASTS